MTKPELSKALELAQTDKDLGTVPNTMDGYGLPGFKPVHVTLKNLAALVRWQCVQLNGEIDSEALNELATLGKKRFIVV